MKNNLTKRHIRETFIGMLRDQPLAQITVQNLVDTCGINRNTFYYHYQNLDELVEDIMMKEVDSVIIKYPTPDSVEDCVYALMDFVQQNHQVFYNIYNSMNRLTIEKYIWKLAHKMVETYLSNIDMANATQQDKEILAVYNESLAFGLSMNALRKGITSQEAKDGVKRMFALFGGALEEVIDNNNKKQSH